MKNLIALILFTLSSVVMAHGQTKKDSTKTVKTSNIIINEDGNYEVKQSPKSVKTDTGKFLITKEGEKLPVFISKNGKLFVVRTSKKSGKQYNQYLNL